MPLVVLASASIVLRIRDTMPTEVGTTKKNSWGNWPKSRRWHFAGVVEHWR